MRTCTEAELPDTAAEREADSMDDQVEGEFAFSYAVPALLPSIHTCVLMS